MHILTSEGKIYEGAVLTEPEAKCYIRISNGLELNKLCSTYINQRDSQAIAAWLCKNFILAERVEAATETEQILTYLQG